MKRQLGACPECGAKRSRVLYYGFPGILCLNGECGLLTGLACYAADLLPQSHDGAFGFFAYEGGGYLRALFHFLFGKRWDT